MAEGGRLGVHVRWGRCAHVDKDVADLDEDCSDDDA